MYLLWPLIIVRICQDFPDYPVTRMAEGFSLFLGGTTFLVCNLMFAIRRDTLTQVIMSLDEKILAVPKDSPRFKKWWNDARKVYIIEGYMIPTVCLSCCLAFTPQLLYVIRTKRLYFDTALPLSDVSLTWQWWVHIAFQSVNPIFSNLFYSLKEFLLFDIYYHLAALYKIQTDTVMELCECPDYDPDEEYQKLRQIFFEMRELDRLVSKPWRGHFFNPLLFLRITKDMNSFISPYIFSVSAMSYIMIAIAGIVILLQSRVTGWIGVIDLLPFPLYVSFVIGVWSYVSELLADSVSIGDCRTPTHW